MTDSQIYGTKQVDGGEIAVRLPSNEQRIVKGVPL